jgi:hypothetical protein
VSGTAGANFSDTAYVFANLAGVSTVQPLPYVAPGSTAAVAIGDLTTPGTPMGGGTNAHDADLTKPVGQQAVPAAYVWCRYLRICNDSGSTDLEFSFDGTNIHGRLKPGEKLDYNTRYEGGIALRGNGAAFRVEAW